MPEASGISGRVGESAPEIVRAWRGLRGEHGGADETLAGCMERIVGVFAEFLASEEGVATFSRGGGVRLLVRETARRQHDLGHDPVAVIEDFAALRRAVWSVAERNANLAGLDGAEVSRFFSKMLDASDWVTEAALQAFDDLAREDVEEAIGRAAATDLLTGLPDRDLFGRVLLPRVMRENERAALVVFDVRRFAEDDDAVGELEGARRALLGLAEAVGEVAPPGSVRARFGDDEVCLLLPGVGSEEAYRCAEEVLGRGHDAGSTLAAGVAAAPEHAADAEGLVGGAVRALRMAKRVGGSAIVIARDRDEDEDGGAA